VSNQKKSLISSLKPTKKTKASSSNAKEVGVKGAKVASLRLASNHSQTSLRLATNHNQTVA